MHAVLPHSVNDKEIKQGLPVMEAFYTLQGEGFHQGSAAYFIRLAGCDVGCFWCDVKESWDEEKHPVINLDDLILHVKKHAAKIVVVTGGEPLLHNLDGLTNMLRNAGFQTHIETSGSSSLSGSWDWICLSPKKFKKPVKEVILAANELKVVIYNKADFCWAEEFAEQVKPECKLFLQPEWTKSNQITPLIIDYIKLNPQWMLSLQIHKYIDVP